MADEACSMHTRKTGEGHGGSLTIVPFHQLCWGIPDVSSHLYTLHTRERTLLHTYIVAGTVRSMFSQVILLVRACSHLTHGTPEPELLMLFPSVSFPSSWPHSHVCGAYLEGREECFPDSGAVVMGAPLPPWHPDAAVTALGLSLHSLMTVCLPHRPASSSWGCPRTPASWSWLSVCATPSTTAAQSTWTTTCSRETWTTLRAPTPTTDCRGCRHPFFFSVMLTSSLMLIYFYGNYIDVLGT